MQDLRAKSYQKLASDTSNSRSGYSNFPTTGGKVGSAAGDVLITQGTKADRLKGGISNRIVYSSQPTSVAVENGKLVDQVMVNGKKVTSREYTTSSQAIQNAQSTNKVQINPSLISKQNNGMSVRNDVAYYAYSDRANYIFDSASLKDSYQNNRLSINYPVSSYPIQPGDVGYNQYRIKSWLSGVKSEIIQNKGVFPTIVKYKNEVIDVAANENSVTISPFGLRITNSLPWNPGNYVSPSQKWVESNFGFKLKGEALGNSLKYGSYAVPGIGTGFFYLDVASFGEKHVYQRDYFYKNPVETNVLVGASYLSNSKLFDSKVESVNARYLLKQDFVGQDVKSVAKFPAGSSFVTVDRSIGNVGPVLSKVTGASEGSSLFPRFSFKRGFYTEDIYSIKGSFNQHGLITKEVGAVSQDSIVLSKGRGSFLLQNVNKNSDFLTFSVKSAGNEVGGFGNRVVNVQSSGRSNQFVDYFKTVSADEDIIYGGNVNRNGVGFFVGKKTYEVGGEVPGGFKTRVVDDFLGIETLDLQPGSTRYYANMNKVKPVDTVFVKYLKSGNLGEFHPWENKIYLSEYLKYNSKKSFLGFKYTKQIITKNPEKYYGINTLYHEQGHAFSFQYANEQVKLGNYYRTSYPKGYGTFEIPSPLDRPRGSQVLKDISKELFNGKNTKEQIFLYYESAGYTRGQATEEFFADMFAKYKESPNIFAQNYPKTAQLYGNIFGQIEKSNINLEISQLPNQVKTTKIYDMRLASQPEIPNSAKFTRQDILNQLKSEKTYTLNGNNVARGPGVSQEASSQLSTVQVKTSFYNTNVLNFEQSFKAGVELNLAKSSGLKLTSLPINSNKLVSQNAVSLISSQQSKQYQNNYLKQNAATGLKLNNENVLRSNTISVYSFGTTNFSKLNNILSGKSNTDTLLKQNPLSGLRVLQAQTQYSAQRTITKNTTATPNVPVFNVPPPNIPGLDFNFYFENQKRKKRKQTISSLKITGYSPSYSALLFGIKGKQPKNLSKSGFDFRPITKNSFKFSSRRMQIEI